MADLNGWGNLIEDIGNGNIFTSAAAGMSFMGGRGYFFNMNSEINHIRAYNECAPLKAIISKRAKAFNNGDLTVVDKNGKPSTKKQATDILAKLDNPNPLQTKRQFLAQMNSYVDLFGYCPLLIVTPIGRPDVINNLWCVPPWVSFDLTFTGNWMHETTSAGIFSAFKIGTENILPENLKLIFDDGFGTDSDWNRLIPDSRLRGLDYDVSNIVAANKSNNTIITRRGPLGILSNDSKDTVGSIPLPEGEKDAIQADFARYGLTGQEYQVIISEANLKWQSMGYAVKDLELQDTIAKATMKLCDAFSYPYALMSSEKSASYNDVKEFEKILYQDGIIPESASRWEQLTKIFFDPKLELKFSVDYSHVAALQMDMQLLATAKETMGKTLERMFKNNVITLNTWLLEIDMDERTDKFGKLYYTDLIKLGFVFGNTTINGGDNLPTGNTSTGNPNTGG